MLSKIIFAVICIIVPFLLIVSIRLYNPQNMNKIYKVLAILILVLELIRFFTNASFYDKAITPAQDVKFSFISFITVFILFGAFNKGKIGKIFDSFTIYLCFVPLVFGEVTNRVYTNTLDIYSILPATYYLQSALIISYACVRIMTIKEVNYKCELGKALVSLGVWILYVGIMVYTKFYWRLDNIVFNQNFWLSVSLPIISIPFIYLCVFLYNTFYVKKHINMKKDSENSELCTVQD